jgi:shikimate kinase
LINRIKNSKKRPLAFNSKKNELVEIIRKRSNIYSKARYKVECEKLTKNQIAEKILKIYETY